MRFYLALFIFVILGLYVGEVVQAVRVVTEQTKWRNEQHYGEFK